MKLVNRYHLWASLECQHFSKAEAVLKFSAEEDGMWVQWQDYASLKEEVDRLNREASDVERFNNSQCEPNTRGYYLKLLNQAYDQGNEHYRLFVVERSKAGMAEDEISFLKAEVERLNVVIGLEQKTIRNLQQTPEWSEITRLTAYCRDLQAEVERLNEDNRQLKKAFEIAEGIIKRMGNAAENAAKEGKPSV